ncbi:hypothetical protein M2459_001592 [Parabacteroides sp. PF5-5]|uniref:hypothetical protein n=1 Tax=unclassified Parabacteroides TaxID=2649774 RepID=UPI0024755BDE|nr:MULTISPECIES: hypothetical protein [unclassified Parabacteroides]MDH6304854.1 hypothetical protein [Parabacteroides sp. PH5-39]MDH6316060.1 hypothetical protein [Parabacteroides sp. PF5-13]MDH6319717.1 hypothetical protein [Parabacteroides sp. PH5-13]MDH6323448.1 hypothetical protein [Parabacteroides sp. PH5-8]MDH6327044.1 hypothetical protein [Parabacteroides sp. PH5-41]
MKANYLILSLLMLLLISSCNAYQQVHTRIHKDGSIERELFAFGDSTFMAGNTNSNPFLFIPDKNWQITRYDSAFVRQLFGKDVKFNAKATVQSASLETFTNHAHAKDNLQPLMLPTETLQKRFCWFYTYYTYKAVYATVRPQLPVSIDKYLTEDEQRILLQGNLSAFEGMNGIEQSDELNELVGKFETWFMHCQFEITINAFAELLLETGETQYAKQLSDVRATLFEQLKDKIDDKDIDSEMVASLLDAHFRSTFYASFEASHTKAINDSIDEQSRLLNLFEYALSFSIDIPGRLLTANTPLRYENSPVWKIDAYRFLVQDYELYAESRTANVWTFVVTGLLLLIAFISLYLTIRKNRDDHMVKR